MSKPPRIEFDLSARALERWRPLSLASTAQNEIRILQPIGADLFGEGVTAASVADDLQRFGADADITLLLNSPGGDFAEGLSIFNLLEEHRGRVTAKVLGIAASAASVITMAADDIQIGREAFLMIHRSWAVILGNAGDLREFAQTLDRFDASMQSIYARRSGEKPDTVLQMMAAETWLNGEQAVAAGFADSILGDAVQESEPAQSAAHLLRRIEAALRSDGMSRAEARRTVASLRQQDEPDELDIAMRQAEQLAVALQTFNLEGTRQ